jgi:GNAT superfamily N-acetyltransferase
VRGTTVVGFLLGDRMLLPPADFASQWVPPYSIAMPIEGHAVADGEPCLAVYRSLYAALAERWVASGFFVHRISIPAGDRDSQEAWVTLGFGRQTTAATRTVGDPVAQAGSPSLTVERASPEDIEEVLSLADELDAWHWQSPMFWPVIHAAEKAVREFNLAALRSSQTPYFIAYDQGRPVGMQSFLRPGFTPPIVARERDVYLFDGIVAGSARGSGIGSRLLSESMRWAASAGFESCSLHFAPANPSGAPFWLSQGFVPVEHTMERVIDARIAWARPHAAA